MFSWAPDTIAIPNAHIKWLGSIVRERTYQEDHDENLNAGCFEHARINLFFKNIFLSIFWTRFPAWIRKIIGSVVKMSLKRFFYLCVVTELKYRCSNCIMFCSFMISKPLPVASRLLLLLTHVSIMFSFPVLFAGKIWEFNCSPYGLLLRKKLTSIKKRGKFGHPRDLTAFIRRNRRRYLRKQDQTMIKRPLPEPGKALVKN